MCSSGLAKSIFKLSPAYQIGRALKKGGNLKKVVDPLGVAPGLLAKAAISNRRSLLGG